MTKTKSNVTIKGTKDGFSFLLNDACPFDDLVKEIQYKLENSHQQILTGPIVHVQVKSGQRELSEEEKHVIKGLIKERGNLIVQSIESDHISSDLTSHFLSSQVIYGMVRSGQVLEHEGNLLLMGDVNPGGTVRSSGDIYVMGMLRGTAHAGIHGNRQAIIAASHMRPTQLRIAQVISRPPDEWESGSNRMEFAYLQNNHMSIEKISLLHRIRTGAGR
jgi:septum site-determining protein MinC